MSLLKHYQQTLLLGFLILLCFWAGVREYNRWVQIGSLVSSNAAVIP